jgi:biotin carboxylase
MTKKLLILGASRYQIPVIEAANRLGFLTVTADNVESNPGHRLANRRYLVSSTDFTEVLSLARKEGVSGVISPATDVAVTTAAFVSRELLLPGPPFTAAQVLTDKFKFREFQRKAGLPHPRAFLLDRSDTAVPKAALNGRSWLLKPCRASGSKGVYILTDMDDLPKRAEESRSFSIDGKALIEELKEGSHHTCEGILRDGRAVLSMITDRDTASPPYTATVGHRVPSNLPPERQTKALAMIEAVFRLLGVRDGPFDCDFIASASDIFIIEMTPRLGGNSLSELFSLAVGFDLVSYAIHHAVGNFLEIPEPSVIQPSAMVILGTDRRGQLEWNMEEAIALTREPWLSHLRFDYVRGTTVGPMTDGRHRVGEAMILGKNRDEVDTRIAELKRRLSLSAVVA